MTNKELIELCRRSALGADLNPDDPNISAMSNNIAAVIALEFECIHMEHFRMLERYNELKSKFNECDQWIGFATAHAGIDVGAGE